MAVGVGWGAFSLLSIGLVTVSSLLCHCTPVEKWRHSVPKKGQESSIRGVCRARSSDYVLLGCSKDPRIPSHPSVQCSHRLPFPWGCHRTVLPMCQPVLRVHPKHDPAGTLLPPLSSLRLREGTSPCTHTPATTHYCVKHVRFQHCAGGSPRWKILAQRFFYHFQTTSAFPAASGFSLVGGIVGKEGPSPGPRISTLSCYQKHKNYR